MMSTSWRTDPSLAGRFHQDYPDDLQVLVHDGGPRFTRLPPEMMWVHVTEKQGLAYAGTLLNVPHQLQSVRKDDKILFLPPKDAKFPPIYTTAAYLAERD